MADPSQSPPDLPEKPPRFVDRALNAIERVGNKLPDPAALFFILLVLVWILSAIFASVSFSEIDPRTGQPIVIKNQLAGTSIAAFLAGMVTTFTSFHPLGVVLVALLGVGVAEHTGFINAAERIAHFTSALLLPPVILVASSATRGHPVMSSHRSRVIFHAAGRHPLAGIAAAFAGVSGGFSANFIPSSLDPLLSGLTQAAAQIINPERLVNPLCNWFFTGASTLVIIGLGWFLTDRVIEPRLRGTPVRRSSTCSDGESRAERNAGIFAGLAPCSPGSHFVLRFRSRRLVLRAPDALSPRRLRRSCSRSCPSSFFSSSSREWFTATSPGPCKAIATSLRE